MNSESQQCRAEPGKMIRSLRLTIVSALRTKGVAGCGNTFYFEQEPT